MVGQPQQQRARQFVETNLAMPRKTHSLDLEQYWSFIGKAEVTVDSLSIGQHTSRIQDHPLYICFICFTLIRSMLTRKLFELFFLSKYSHNNKGQY
jgi:hypothetical protein